MLVKKIQHHGAYGYAHGLVCILIASIIQLWHNPNWSRLVFVIPNWSSWTHGPNIGQFLITWINVHLHWYYDPIFVATTNRFTSVHPPNSSAAESRDRNHEDSLFRDGQWSTSRSFSGWWGLPTPLKNDGLKVSMSVMMKFPTVSGKSFKNPWFQTTNQIWCLVVTLQKTREKHVQFMKIHRVLANVRKTNGFPYLC